MARSDRDQRGKTRWQYRPGELRYWRGRYNRVDRRLSERDLRSGRDPAPIQPRGRARSYVRW